MFGDGVPCTRKTPCGPCAEGMRLARPRKLADGHGNIWLECGWIGCQLEIVRPGKVQCVLCDSITEQVSEAP